MSQDVYIFEVSEKSFPSAVIENSHKLPVVVEFMGVWSEPCFAVDETFSTLAREFAGQFIFAKVDIDEQPELRKQYHIENVPTLVVIKDGNVSRVDMGLLTDVEARALLREQGISHESDDMREQARDKHMAGDTAGAIMLLTQAIQKHPSNTRVAMDMVQIFIDINELENARGLFKRLPERDQNSDMGKSLAGQLAFAELAAKTEGLEALQARVEADNKDAQGRFDLAICLVAQHDFKQAMDHLLYMVQHMADFNDGAAREMMITLLRMIKENSPELAAEYQRKLSNIMAK